MAALKKKTKKIVKKKSRSKIEDPRRKSGKPVKKTVNAVKKKPAVKKTVKKIKKTKQRIKTKKRILKKKIPQLVKKFSGNPIMGPRENSFWESEAVFNPAAVVYDGRVHLFYRALGPDGLSRVGYASSKDGIHFDDRSAYPVYVAENIDTAKSHFPYTSPARFVYDQAAHCSGGGWGGCEDPRAVVIDGRIYMTFNMFNGWESMRVAYTSLSGADLMNKRWNWDRMTYLSRPGDRQKNWVLFPEKFDGKFALFHNLDLGDASRVHIAFLDELNMHKTPSQKEAPDIHTLPDHIVAWHNRTRSASAPPIRTKEGWLLFYHAMDKDDAGRYKLGCMMLDLKDPKKVLYRSAFPILEPNEWYENDWKPGIIYASGVVVKDGTLFVYYGGGDKRIAVATANLDEFIRKLKTGGNAVLTKKSVLKI